METSQKTFAMRTSVLIVVFCSSLAAVSLAHADKFHVTAAEKAACSVDAARLCASSFPDEDKLLSCMKDNRSALSTACLVAFDTGVKRRHL